MTDENSGKDKDGKVHYDNGFTLYYNAKPVWITVSKEAYEEYTARAGEHPSKQAKHEYYKEIHCGSNGIRVNKADYDKISNRDSLPEISIDRGFLGKFGLTKFTVFKALVLEKDKQLGKEYKDTH